jgi:hypothetical protein
MKRIIFLFLSYPFKNKHLHRQKNAATRETTEEEKKTNSQTQVAAKKEYYATIVNQQ